ncbi:MAG: MBL fold metallo-hydrolase [Myxococcota bacterium]
MVALWKKSMGAKRARGCRLERMQASPQWQGGKFANALPREEPKLWSATREFMVGGSKHRRPTAPLPIVPRTGTDFASGPASGLRVTWLGHSTSLIEIDGHRVLLDPVFGERASPIEWLGPKRFHPPPLPLHDLPHIDVVVVSHDHYDHLDHTTAVTLGKKGLPFVVPLGVGAHLETWGVDAETITELDWWEHTRVGNIEVSVVPARHFSGRGPTPSDRDHTLWGGIALVGPAHRVYFSGDTAMFPGFTEIGKRLGPFDIALIESGAYNQLWRDAHIGPEQAALAAKMIEADILLPVHWGTFDLALHGWTDPVERLLLATRGLDVTITTPRIGESVELGQPLPDERWWPELPLDEREIVVSSHLPDELEAQVLALV